MNKKDIEQIAKAVSVAVAESMKPEEEEPACPIGLTEKHVEALDDLTDLMRNSKKAIRKTIIKIVVWAIICGALLLIGEKFKALAGIGAKLLP